MASRKRFDKIIVDFVALRSAFGPLGIDKKEQNCALSNYIIALPYC